MALKFHNTLTHQKELFKTDNPADKRVNLYTCGPTVYNYAHIGNLRSYIFADLVYRALKFDNYEPVWVMNITDVDDKTIKNTIEESGPKAFPLDLEKYTDKYFQIFLTDLDKLNIQRNEIRFIKVSEAIPQIQEFIVGLLDKGYAYQADDGSTYFSLEKYQQDFGNYGALVGDKFLEGKKVGAGSTSSPQARIKADEYEKNDLSDFALWKAHGVDDGQIFWDHPVLGKGRPGWHIECSTINKIAFDGKVTDIHTGGVDLIFPHHTNEIAQSEALTGHKFVNYWLHSEHLFVDGKKMAKSLGNFYELKDLEAKGFDPLAYRFLLLQSSFSQTMNFTWESLLSAQKGYENLKNKIEALKNPASEKTKKNDLMENPHFLKFKSAIENMNTASALASLQSVFSAKDLASAQKLELIAKFDEILGLKLI